MELKKLQELHRLKSMPLCNKELPFGGLQNIDNVETQPMFDTSLYMETPYDVEITKMEVLLCFVV